jgi:hypothetical protein
MYVICQYFAHRNAARAAEYEYCLRDHIRNGHQLILFEEQPAPEDIRQGAAKCIPYPQRITYEFVFQWANENLPAGSVAALVNLDILVRFKGADAEAYFQRNPQHLMCLSRLEYRPELGTAVPDPVFESRFYWNCQDAWVFRVPAPVLPRSDFAVGNCPGCDNAIAFRAAEGGLIPVNVAGSFPIWHYDTKPKELKVGMTYDKKTEFVRPERGGRLFLPRIKEGGTLDLNNFLTMARDGALTLLNQEGYGMASDAKLSNYLACLTGLRCVNRWDLQYLFACIAINNAYFLINP